MKVGVGTLRKATFVVAGLVVATGGSTLGLALAGGGSGSAQAGGGSPRSDGGQSAQQPVTAAGSSASSSSTSTTVQPTGAAQSTTGSITSTTGAPTTTAGTTTPPPPPPCQWSQFATTVTTQGAYYSQGQTIPFTVTVENTGAACTDQGQEHCDCWGAYAENSSGQTMWVWGAPGPPTSSISVTSPPPVVPAHWSTSRQLQWDQSACTYSSCPPNRDVGPGTYQIIGLWADHVTPKPNASPAVSVTILPI